MSDAAIRKIWADLVVSTKLRKAMLPLTKRDAKVTVRWVDDDDFEGDVSESVLCSSELYGDLAVQGNYAPVHYLRMARKTQGLPFMGFTYTETPATRPASAPSFSGLFAFQDLSTIGVLGKKSNPAINAAHLLTCVLNDLACQNYAMESVFGTFVHHVMPWILLSKSTYLPSQHKRSLRQRDRERYDATERVVAQIEPLGIVSFAAAALVTELEQVFEVLEATDIRFYGNMLQPPPLTLPFVVWDKSLKSPRAGKAGMGLTADLILKCTTAEHGPTVLVVELKTTYVSKLETRAPQSSAVSKYLRQAGVQALAVAFAVQDIECVVIPVLLVVHVPRDIKVFPRGDLQARRQGCTSRHYLGNPLQYRHVSGRQLVADMIEAHLLKPGKTCKPRGDDEDAVHGFGVLNSKGKVVVKCKKLWEVHKTLTAANFRGRADYPWTKEMK